MPPRSLRIEGRGDGRPNLRGASTTVAGIDPKYYYLTLGLLVFCTLVGLIVAYSFQREVNEDLSPPTEKDLLGPLEKAYYSGLMREDEFLRIQESMARQRGEEPPPAPKPREKSSDVEGPPSMPKPDPWPDEV